MKKLLLVAILMLALVITAVACNNDPVIEETSADTTAAAPETTLAPETTAEDTTVVDTTAEDTTAEDTTVEDTTAEDTTVEDTTVEDTTAEDTTVEDTTAEDTTAAPEKGTYNVKVVDDKGNVLAGATVEFFVGNECKYTQATNENGVVSVELDKIDYTVKVTLEGYAGEASYSLTATKRMIQVTLTKAVEPEPEPETAPFDKTYAEAQGAEIPGFQWVQYLVDGIQVYGAWGGDGKYVYNLADNSPVTDPTLVLAAGTQSFSFYGWIGVADTADNPGSFGYSVDGAAIVYDAAFMPSPHNEGVWGAGFNLDATSVPDFRINADLTGLTGAHTIQYFYKTAAGVVVQLDVVDVIIESEDDEPEIETAPFDKTYDEALASGELCGLQWVQYHANGFHILDGWGMDGKVASGPVTLDLAEYSSFAYYGWVGVADTLENPGMFGYSVDGSDIVYSADFVWAATDDGATALTGGNTSPCFRITVELDTLTTGKHLYQAFYKTSAGTVILLDTIELVIVSGEPEPEIVTEPVYLTGVYEGWAASSAGVHNGVGSPNFAMQFNIGEAVLKQITVYEMATFEEITSGCVNTWNVTIYQWNTDYATTVSGEPLCVIDGSDHQNMSNFVVDIPADKVITGEVLVVVTCVQSGPGAFTGWACPTDIPGYTCYLSGMNDLEGTPVKDVCASIVVEKVAGDGPVVEPEPEPEVNPENQVEPYPTNKVTFVEALNGKVFGIQWSQYRVDGVQTYQAWAGTAQNVTTFDNPPVAVPLPIVLPEGTLTFGYYGWIGASDDCRDAATRGIFGYSIDGGNAIFNETFYWIDPTTGTYTYHNKGVFDNDLTPGATSAPNFDIVVDLAGLTGTHTIESFYKAADGTVILLDTITIVIGTPTPEPEADPNDKSIVLSQFNGCNGETYWNDDSTSKVGQRFNIGEATLKKLTVYSLATFEGTTNTFTVTFWKWDSNYETTVSGTPLYVYNGSNHMNNADFVLAIPADVVLTGDIFYEINVLSSANVLPGSPAVFMTWIGIDQIEGLASYKGGVKQDTNYAASIVINKTNPYQADTLPLTPEVFGPVIEEVPLYLGEVTDELQNPDGKTLGLRFDMGGDVLAQVGIYDMVVADGSNPANWTVKVYEWADDYDTTIAGEPLFEGTGTINADGNYVVDIPVDLEITCNILVVIEGMQPGDSGYVADDPWWEWGVDESFYNCYLDGELSDLLAAFYAYPVPEDMM